MADRKVKDCALEYSVVERNQFCGDDLVCHYCGWNKDEAKRRRKELRLYKCNDGLWRMK